LQPWNLVSALLQKTCLKKQEIWSVF